MTPLFDCESHSFKLQMIKEDLKLLSRFENSPTLVIIEKAKKEC
jgi:hypothetical protein